MDSKKSRGLLRPNSAVVVKRASIKGRHGENKEAPDRISSLPDFVLCHILSFLPTKYAVGTSVLSTRWQNLFVSVPVLDFNDSLTKNFAPYRNRYDSLTNSSFSNFVRRVLSLHKVMRIPKFSLKCVKYHYEVSDVCSWISAAIARNVQELEVVAFFVQGGSLPRALVECKSLVVLKICGEFEIPLSGSVCLLLLKTLHLVNMSLSLEDTTWRVSSHFPALEDLLLERFLARGKVVDISIPSLKRLELIVVREFSRIVLNAPALDYLNYNSNAAVGFSVSELNSLVKARIDIQNVQFLTLSGTTLERREVSAEFPNFVNMLHNVQFLTLSATTLEAIQDSNCSLPTFRNLIRLEITDSDCGWQLVSDLLESSPLLQYLVFGEWLPIIGDSDSDADEEPVLPAGAFFDVDGLPRGERHLCLSLHMKEIEIKKFGGGSDDYKICEYFLKKAKVLDKLIVHSFGGVEQHLETSLELLAFPRSSPTCRVQLFREYE